MDGWVKCMKTKLDPLGLGNLIGNIFKAVMGKFQKKNTTQNINSLQKRPTDCYIQNQVYNNIDNDDNRSFFTQLKQTYKKSRDI